MGSEWNNDGFENRDNFQNEESSKFGNYSEQDYAFQTLMRNGRPKTFGWSVASLVMGLLSVVCCYLGWSGIIFGIAAFLLSLLSRKKLGYFDGMSIAGLILGIFGFVFGVSILISVNFLITEEMMEEFWEEFYKSMEEFEGEVGPSDGSGI